jgi:Leucine-rich repeat (LRR) protein
MKNIIVLIIVIISAALLASCFRSDETPPVISVVLISDITRASAVITWTTDETATSQVEYDLTKSYGAATTLDTKLVTSHSVSLSGLTAGTIYHYRVKSNDASGNEKVSKDYTFTTQSPPIQPRNLSPGNRAAGVSLAATLLSSTFSDLDAGDTHAASQWRVTATSGDYSNPVFDSGTDATNLTSVTIPPGTFGPNTTYYWRVRHQDYYGAWSSYSRESSFTTLIFPDENLGAAIREALGKPDGPVYVFDLEELHTLNASDRNITDITGLEYCINITMLYLQSNQISDISPLSGLTSLTVLNLSDNQIDDITALENLTSLTQLTLTHNQIRNITPLSDLTNLSLLYLQSNRISNITPLSNLTSLRELSLWGNRISNITSVSNFTSLTRLDLEGNQISNITPLSDLTGLKRLGLFFNEIVNLTPLSGLTNLTFLGLWGNEIVDITPLVDNEGLSEGDEVVLLGNPLNTESYDILIPQLEARGVTVYYDTG